MHQISSNSQALLEASLSNQKEYNYNNNITKISLFKLL